MKILWFTNTPSLYDQGKHSYHGGGWIESLEQLIKEQQGIELAVSFFHKMDSNKVLRNETTYYPMLRKSAKKNPFQSVVHNWKGRIEPDNFEAKCLEIANDFQPDVIHVFGTEGPFAKLQGLINIPVVIHIQGLINPCLNAYYPSNYSEFNFLLNKNYFFNTLIGNSPVFGRKRFAKQAKREHRILSNAKYVMGRTHWDKMLAELYNPKVHYFHVDEVLRPVFYQAEQKSKQSSVRPFKILSTISPTIYKGIDVVLKTAKQLKQLTGIDFEWEIIGLDKSSTLLRQFERTEKIKHQDVNIACSGRKSPEEIVALMQSSDVFVHPSYIDNSPNSICEAQMLGLPVVASNVGGVASLVKQESTGFLVPANGVFEMVHYLKKLHKDKKLRYTMGQEARQAALQRHDRTKIVVDLQKVYDKLNTG